MMHLFRYDKTFEGLLTAVFDAYVRRTFPQGLLAENDPGPLFADGVHRVRTDPQKAGRVWKGLCKKLPREVCNMLMYAWFSELPGSDELLMRYICKVFDSPVRVETDFADDDILQVKKIAQKVSRERHHLIQFLRFQKGGDDTFFAPVKPEFNSLPLAINHFTDRFADQKWLIYDLRRRYGYYYDLQRAVEVTMEDDGHLLGGKLDERLMAADERLFQELWKGYFKSLTIKERINPRLQRQHMPKRYWKYMPEMQ